MKQFYSKRNQEIWYSSQEKQEALFVGYLIAGDPTVEQSLNIVENSLLSGIDILELGVPSEHPYLDGEIIKSGHARVQDKKEINWLMNYWRTLRRKIKNPIWAMGYKKDLFDTGLYRTFAERGLIDALILPDCFYEQRNQVALEVRAFGIDVAQFVHPEMSEQELSQVCSHATIIYAQTYAGTTGNPNVNIEHLAVLYERIRTYSTALIVAGFGLYTPEKVRFAVNCNFDGVVVGSAFVAKCAENQQDDLYRLITAMKKETDFIRMKE